MEVKMMIHLRMEKMGKIENSEGKLRSSIKPQSLLQKIIKRGILMCVLKMVDGRQNWIIYC
jgi:hypothetical protein